LPSTRRHSNPASCFRDQQRHHAEDDENAVIRNSRNRIRARGRAAVNRSLPLSSSLCQTRTIKIAFLQRQSDQDDEADLRQNVGFHPGKPKLPTIAEQQNTKVTIQNDRQGNSQLSY